MIPAAWTAAAVESHRNVRQTAFANGAQLAESGLVTVLDGAAFGPAGFIVVCPIISRV